MDPRLVDPDYTISLSPWFLVVIALVLWLLLRLEYSDSGKSQSSGNRDNARLDTQRNSSTEDDK